MQALKELAADKIDAKDRDSYHLDGTRGRSYELNIILRSRNFARRS